MKAESILLAIGGIVFGLLVGWIIGDQQARSSGPVTVTQSPAPVPAVAETKQPPALDESQAQALATVAQNDDSNVAARVQLGNLYFDAERFAEATPWYQEAFALDPSNPDVSTDLGVSYYYSNQPDKALEQFDRSLEADPLHVKTLLNQGIVLAFGKRDLDGATASWQKVVEAAPAGSQEALAAQRALDSLNAAHDGTATVPGS
jgi:cytochrome c-type biogenesis protein CcmH/NrfG